MTQHSLFLGYESFDSKDILVGEPNESAINEIFKPEWVSPYLCLIGPKASGKSRLVKQYAQKKGAVFLTSFQFALQPNTPYIFENIDHFFKTQNHNTLFEQTIPQAEKDFFNFYETISAKNCTLLLTATTTPLHWPVVSEDLKTRFAILETTCIEQPDSDFALQLLAKLYNDQGINIAPEVLEDLICHLPLNYEALLEFVEKTKNLTNFSLKTLKDEIYSLTF
ncbi:MAG: hypothetical protein JXR30_02045 [Alphaproteobacteria bacterium]|nr:hypothetical protein [Alphaproteobacteria bacterium]